MEKIKSTKGGAESTAIAKLFTQRTLLMVSLALNVGLILTPNLPRESDEKSSSFSISGVHRSTPVEDDGRVINLDHGDPTMYESYWKETGNASTIVIPGWQSMSYFSDPKSLCWFLEPAFADAVTRLHKLVGNADTNGYHIVVGTGSSQLYLAALFALTTPTNASDPIDVVSASPYYSSYPSMTNFLRSGLYKWGGDARNFNKNIPYIELVTSPNNPDGFSRKSIVNKPRGFVIHDFAYYWPHYTAINSPPANHDLMLFTVSKSTGHAGTRTGWALVKDKEVAKRMIKFIELNTIGVSKDSQLRAAKILDSVSESCKFSGERNFFKFGYNRMEERWRKLRDVVEQSGRFTLPEFSPQLCFFNKHSFGSLPAFAWLKCNGYLSKNCEDFLRSHNILTRGGANFGDTQEYARISMIDREENFNMFIQRLSRIS